MKIKINNFNVLKTLVALALFIGIVLRMYSFGHNPPAPYWEEVALGYDAYSILKTGADHHGNFLPVAAFESFGDWKPSLYFYSIIPFIALFDLEVIAVRLPSLLSGLLLIPVTAWLGHRIARVGWLSAVVAALSPWGIHFSRAAWEAHLATLLIGIGIGAWLEMMRESPFKQRLLWGALSTLGFSFSLYAYHAARLVAPLLVVVLVALFIRKYLDKKLTMTRLQLTALTSMGAVIGVLVLFPFLKIFISGELQQLTLRAQQTGMISQNEVLATNIELQNQSQLGEWSRFVYHRYFSISKAMIIEISTYFTPNYLLNTGEENLRHSPRAFGIIYPHEIIFLLLGLSVIVYKKRLEQYLLVIWIAIGLLVASLAVPNPHALRTLVTFPAWMIIIAMGIHFLWKCQFIKTKELRRNWLIGFTSMLIGAYLVMVTGFSYYYFTIYPVISASEWQYGYQGMYDQVAKQLDVHTDAAIYIDRGQGRPAMYWWFYTKTDPKLVQAQAMSANKDQGEFLEFEQFVFVDATPTFEDTTIIIAASPEKAKSWIQANETYQIITSSGIKNVADSTVWQVTVLERIN